ncbi:protein of unknown function [Sphingomonas sp. YR710]|uniref:DUF4402 domain-containing protein n=1 Tax=Sphingomonas sp. YR710 TaxID=1882773 RepID=UPI00087F0C95|nr:DUF4402 domain-containing protein [Sphingomonas sp. YR710]SDC44563.1 protein of unknown function [Sphingomonas sp. YR710]
MPPLSTRSLAIALGALSACPVAAQTYTVSSITAPAFGTLITGVTGTTVFLNNGIVTKQSGSGTVYSGPVTRAVVSINCTDGSGRPRRCSTAGNIARVDIATSGIISGRAQAISNFTANNGTGTIGTGTTTGTSLSFQLTGWTASNTNKTFFLDITLPITGDDVGGTTGAATSGFTVLTTEDPTTPITGLSALATATVRRAMYIAAGTSLGFGSFLRSGTNSGTVTVDSLGTRTVGGASPPILLTTGPGSAATYTLYGEPSTSFTLTVSTPLAFSNGTAVTVPVTLIPSASGSLTMPGGGTMPLTVTGVITVPGNAGSGGYSTSYNVTITYN